jgi:DNA-binding NarL/FixJ family response regulator
VVDDYEPWRSFATRTLQKKPELQVVSEASDGLEAVQKAQELQPDLILLDIGLPTLNGIAAARRILQHAPKTKILFMSEQRSSDIVEEALSTGARGYVVKADAANELLPAVEAVLQGKQFCLSKSLTGSTFANHEIEHIELPPRRKVKHHEVKLYPDDNALVDDFTHFMEAALNVGNAVVVIATELIGDSILQKLSADGVDHGAAAERKRYLALDIANPLSAFTVDEAVKAATREGLHVAVG